MRLQTVDVGKFDLITKYAVMILISMLQITFGVVFIWFASNYPSDDWKWFFATAIFLVIINIPLFFFLWLPWCIRWIRAESDYVLREKVGSTR